MSFKLEEAGNLAPIAVVMPHEALAFVNCSAAFERIAGSPLLNCFTVSLQKNPQSMCQISSLILFFWRVINISQ